MPGKRNPEDRKKRLIKAVGDTLAERGHRHLGLNKIALRANVSKPMIYEYFDSLNGLLKTYISGKDTWIPYFQSLVLPENPTIEELRDCFIHMLHDQFHYFLEEKEMQKLVLWQISEYNPLMRATCENREREGIRILELADDHFKNTGISLKAVMALMVGGIYFNVLHDSAGAGTMAGIDISNDNDHFQLLKTMTQVVTWAFDAASKVKAMK
ncbi:TetR/AcrR family transcriptional regulator [Mucilaginibacter corticis]|uniref:TetR/AcrR family transcriptional regulator n=1 Tax=Mucilaginibacter corticis TaxID=2597670 RepID=A0A556MGA3_9SPHI|nr:TetR/AcrR family transcriptional regulator [Mucilaginibacter corticis]TSJ38910.1 TetR/AcrR family transcriptional regulator [Mucilaginibacter corticis]